MVTSSLVSTTPSEVTDLDPWTGVAARPGCSPRGRDTFPALSPKGLAFLLTPFFFVNCSSRAPAALSRLMVLYNAAACFTIRSAKFTVSGYAHLAAANTLCVGSPWVRPDGDQRGNPKAHEGRCSFGSHEV
ncbi:unnamed protein product [Trichogramma brassicae]|uniref:Uncharacterized protein n=1 Tax=Trichogramma brassicae TaxID=86971 RepID=A0A6H5I014_9HYME|nr:unnamed protein product [Trichogramma brassicae]